MPPIPPPLNEPKSMIQKLPSASAAPPYANAPSVPMSSVSVIAPVSPSSSRMSESQTVQKFASS